MKIIDLLKDEKFENKNVLEKLISHHMNISKTNIFSHYEKEIPDDIWTKIKNDYYDYEQNHKPLDYILWYVQYWGLKFDVNKHTLIPRPETEYMILSVQDFLEVNKVDLLIDVGTGCGVLGLSALAQHPDNIKKAYLTEICPKALDVARWNYEKLIGNKFTNINFLQTDLLDCLDDEDMSKYNDILIVANLPYIPDSLFDNNVEDNVKKREPRFAFVWWDDGCDLYRLMFDQLDKAFWNWPGNLTMFLEMMDNQADILADEYTDIFEFQKVATFHFNIKILKATKI